MISLARTTQDQNLILYFQVHQPRRLATVRFFDIGSNKDHFNEGLNREIIERISRDCYLPANALLLELIKQHPGIRVAFSISGTMIDQLEAYAPEVLLSFKALADTGCVEFLTETYYHSLACMMPGSEFELQVVKHQRKISEHFGMASKVFRNTELIYSDDIATRIKALGFRGVIIDGIDRLLENKSCQQVFEHGGMQGLTLIPRDYRLSDEISFRYSQGGKSLSAKKYISWLEATAPENRLITLAMDYETFGEHQKKERGIFQFMRSLLSGLAKHPRFGFMTPTEAVETFTPAAAMAIPGCISWADEERNLSAWLGNEMQRDAFDSMVKLESDIKNLHNKALLREWRCLQTSDHFYYMSTKKGNDGEVHAYFSPYPSPYEAFINYMNVLTDLELRISMLKSESMPVPEPKTISPDIAFEMQLS